MELLPYPNGPVSETILRGIIVAVNESVQISKNESWTSSKTKP